MKICTCPRSFLKHYFFQHSVPPQLRSVEDLWGIRCLMILCLNYTPQLRLSNLKISYSFIMH
ncbi:hypothetical protein MXB_4396 [Myxobolus squamalis]|nr:hypothetical protein MXB_4396 [Myxobolus squamalis]